jgi:ribosome assembly protein 4
MATLLPHPSKKQKREIAEKAREQQEIDILPRDLGSVVLQFIDESTGKSTKGEIKVPVANTTVRELETILNTILENVGKLGSFGRRVGALIMRMTDGA